MNALLLRTINVFCVALVLSITVAGCGDSQDCVPVITITSVDPSGRWTGTLVRQESDCATESKGERFNFSHDVSLVCDAKDEASVELVNEDQRTFQSTEFNLLAGGSFSVRSERENSTIDISYDNYDGSLADVTQKIRNYSNGKIVCSELYSGQARR